jgi:hypothetical protein
MPPALLARQAAALRALAALTALSAAQCLAAAQAPAQAQPPAAGHPIGGELRLRLDDRAPSRHGPLAAANTLQPGIAPPTPDSLRIETELRGQARLGALTLGANAAAWAEHGQGGQTREGARINELHLSTDAGAWQASAGKKLVEWDVGYGFRPNDMVQQAERRSLATATAEGRPLLKLEHFSAERAISLVWAHPQRLNSAPQAGHDADESAFAARLYQRAGALDLHGFLRWGRHSHASAGAAAAWVATDALALHASLRHLARHAPWVNSTSGQNQGQGQDQGMLLAANPWQRQWRGTATQVMAGGQWTGGLGLSMLVEAWHDGSAPSRAEWRAWSARNAVLQAMAAPAPASARAGNLAWQSTPWRQPNLHRDNLFLRLAWQPEGWQLAIDTLWHPADGGHITTASLQWQGDAWRVNASVRTHSGPPQALLRQLPLRRQAMLALTRAF